MYLNLARTKDITLNHQITDNIVAFADIHLLETTLRNLINNAIKFTPKGGPILINASKKNTIYISVTDTGTGMTSKQLNSLYNLESTHSKQGTKGEKGSGLGLVLCKEFVEQNKGTISVESHVGKGITFSFTVPAGFSSISKLSTPLINLHPSSLLPDQSAYFFVYEP